MTQAVQGSFPQGPASLGSEQVMRVHEGAALASRIRGLRGREIPMEESE